MEHGSVLPIVGISEESRGYVSGPESFLGFGDFLLSRPCAFSYRFFRLTCSLDVAFACIEFVGSEHIRESDNLEKNANDKIDVLLLWNCICLEYWQWHDTLVVWSAD